MSLVKSIDALLPQTQCGECGFPGCLPYAEALATGSATINLCPPGGESTLNALGGLLGVDPAPYRTEVLQKTRKPSLAVIQEADCIGCTKCIKACPVDAIIGSSKTMHAILTQDCTGCGLCVAPCPVDCIEMVEVPEASFDKDRARARFIAKKTRALREEHEREQSYRLKKQLAQKTTSAQQDAQAKKDYILQALARVKAKKKD